MTLRIQTKGEAKARARIYKAQLAFKGQTITHSAALEHVAKQSGYRNWNAMSARLPNSLNTPFRLGNRVTGAYMKKSFHGRVIALRRLQNGRAHEITVEFDNPVDVVHFNSFSNLRKRARVVVAPSGVSVLKTSDGAPYMVVTPDLH